MITSRKFEEVRKFISTEHDVLLFDNNIMIVDKRNKYSFFCVQTQLGGITIRVPEKSDYAVSVPQSFVRMEREDFFFHHSERSFRV